MDLLTKFKAYLRECFRLKDLGKLKYFLGIKVARADEGIFLSQRKYVLDIIADTGLLGAKPVSIPLEQNHQLAGDKGPFNNKTRPVLYYYTYMIMVRLSNTFFS